MTPSHHPTTPRLYNTDPHKPPLLYSKTGVYRGIHYFFLISAKKQRLWVRSGSNEYHNLCLEQKYEKYQFFLSENIQFLEVKIFYIFEKACFRNGILAKADVTIQ